MHKKLQKEGVSDLCIGKFRFIFQNYDSKDCSTRQKNCVTLTHNKTLNKSIWLTTEHPVTRNSMKMDETKH